jgi:hypothetical protein
LALTLAQKNYIIQLDNTADEILECFGMPGLMLSIPDEMVKIKDIMDSASENELDMYCQQYSGFYQYMKLLEELALAISKGEFNDILKR